MIPKFLYERLESSYEKDAINKIIEGYQKERPVTLRINTLKATKEEIHSCLEKECISYERVSWYEDALIIKNKKEDEIKNLSMYKEGKIYLQSLSSMLPPLFLNASEKEQILDMTAAPGGKTTEIAALTHNKAMITAMEKNKIRAERLKYNVEKQGAKKVVILNQDARELNPYFIFDKILLDAPCSGSGTYTLKDLPLFKEDLIKRSITFQKELVKEAVKHVKVGGEILYSTCSILKEENECIIKEILKDKNIELIPLEFDKFEDIPTLPVNIKGTLCVCPSSLYEGFYIAKIKRIS